MTSIDSWRQKTITHRKTDPGYTELTDIIKEKIVRQFQKPSNREWVQKSMKKAMTAFTEQLIDQKQE